MELRDWTTIAGLVLTIVLAISGYLYKYVTDKNARKRQGRLLIINKQLEEFYGPLFFRAVSGERSYQELLKKLGKPQVSQNPSQQELKEWRLWYKTVFHPVNLEIEKIILEKSYLIREEEIPRPLIDFIAHITPYKTIVTKWENNDYTEHFSSVDFPKEFKGYIHRSYYSLKNEQLHIMNS